MIWRRLVALVAAARYSAAHRPGLLGDDAFFGHLLGAFVGALEHRQVGTFGIDPVVFDGFGCGSRWLQRRPAGRLWARPGRRSRSDRAARGGLTLLHLVADVHVELLDDAAGLGLHLDFGDGLDLAGGDDGAGYVAALGFAELGRVELGGVAAGFDRDAENDDDDERR